MISIETFVLGAYMTNCYLICDQKTQEMAVIDPGYSSDKLVKQITKTGENHLKYIFLTHGHFDHIGFVTGLQALTNAKVVIGEDEAELLCNNQLNLAYLLPEGTLPCGKADILLKDNQSIMLGESKVSFIKTPGHTAGSGCYIIDNHMFTGDTIMKGTVGRVDMPTGSREQMMESMVRLKNLKEDYILYPGHGGTTTLNSEKNYNPYIGDALNEDLYR